MGNVIILKITFPWLNALVQPIFYGANKFVSWRYVIATSSNVANVRPKPDCISVCTYFAGQKKNSNADVEKSAFFQGEITAKLDQLIKTVDKLDQKLTRNTGELHEEIDKKILDHERRYH